MRLLYPSSNLVNTWLLHVELVFLDDVANLLLQTLSLLVGNVCYQIETSLTEYGNPLFCNANLCPLSGRGMTESLDVIKTELAGVSSDFGSISEALGASAQEVSASCTAVTQATGDTRKSAGEMKKVNANMSEAISFFKI